jgi:hypothetical protein
MPQKFHSRIDHLSDSLQKGLAALAVTMIKADG